VGAAVAADTAAAQQPHGQQAEAGDQLMEAAPAGLQVTGAKQHAGCGRHSSRGPRSVPRRVPSEGVWAGMRWLCQSRVGRMVRAAAGGLLVFEAGRQLGWLAGRLGR
jgi:hypothetical protein